MSRRIAKARETLLATTHRNLQDSLGLVRREVEGLTRAMGSQLEFSLSKVLRNDSDS